MLAALASANPSIDKMTAHLTPVPIDTSPLANGRDLFDQWRRSLERSQRSFTMYVADATRPRARKPVSALSHAETSPIFPSSRSGRKIKVFLTHWWRRRNRRRVVKVSCSRGKVAMVLSRLRAERPTPFEVLTRTLALALRQTSRSADELPA